MHHERELMREKTEVERQTPSEFGDEQQSARESDTGNDDRASNSDVILVNFQPGEPADPHNWSNVS